MNASNLTVVVLCLAAVVASTSARELDPAAVASNVTSDRSGKFFSMFSLVRFTNDFCLGENTYNGTCLTATECSAKTGSVASGSCAQGFGVCCTVFISTCGQTTSLNNTYWQNADYPDTSTTAGQCALYVAKMSSQICQLRLDFIKLVIADPDQSANTATQCLVDIFTVSGASNNVPAICGTATDQHMYIDVSPATNQVTLSMLLSGTATSRSWLINVAQIPCGTIYTAPHDCLQWFTDAVGTFSSFNYLYAATPVVQHLANQDYTICIRTNEGFCGIGYSVCDSSVPDASKFLMSVETTGTVVDVACTSDFIAIPCAKATQTSDGATCNFAICGDFFSAATGSTASATAYSYRKPFEVRVYTDSADATTTEGIGFCLKYQQLPCLSASG